MPFPTYSGRIIIMLIALVFTGSSLWAQDIAGKWSNKDNPNPDKPEPKKVY